MEDYITAFFKKNSNSELVYHDLDHTQSVVSHVKEISKYYALNKNDLFIVESAAWFHDIGYLIQNEPTGHELLGAELAAKYLKDNLVAGDIIAEVKACIMVTILPQNPQTLLQQILCDADLYHLGTSDLFMQDELIHKEVEFRIGHPIENRKWINGTIGLLNSHSYHTEYCQRMLNHQKRLNLNRFEMMLRNMNI